MDALQVQMLGGFAMYYGGRPILLKKIESSKAARLLQMLLVAAPGGIPKTELLDNLYGWDDGGDSISRNRNLNNVIYRLRNILTAAGLPEDNYVEIVDGVCRFSGHLPLETDVGNFEKTVAEALDDEIGGVDRLNLLEKANRIYIGELFPMSSACQWIFEKSNDLKKLYLQTVQLLEIEYQKRHDYMNLLGLYTRVASIYPYENWQVKQIRCYLEMYRYDEALSVYNQTMEMYARDMGNPPTQEMQQCFEEMNLHEAYHHERKDLSSWKTMDTIFMGREGNIIKTIFETDSVSGAYYCTYPSFIDHCRVLVRNRSRHDPRAMLMFLTLNQNYSKKDTSSHMDLLKMAIGHSLRKGDTYTRYGNRHFILMLTDISNKDDCGIVFRRIEKAYYEAAPVGDELWYHAAMTQELEEAMGGVPVS